MGDISDPPHITEQELRTLRQQLAILQAERDAARQELATLRAERECFRIMADFTYDWEYWLTPEGTLRYVSPACERITGYRPDEFQADPGLLERIVHPGDCNQFSYHVRAARQLQQPYELEFRIITRSGGVRWISHACQPVYGSDGVWLGQRASNRDITTQKQAEAALRDEHQRFERGPVVIISWEERAGWPVCFVSPNIEQFGYTPNDLIEEAPSFLSLIHPNDRDRVCAEIQQIRATHAPPLTRQDYRLICADGSVRHIADFSRPVYDHTGAIVRIDGYLLDVTEQKQAEEAYTLLVEHSLQALQIFQDGRIVFTNAAAAHLTGFSRQEILALSPEAWPLLIYPDDRAELVQRSRDRLAGKPVSPRYECRFIRRDGAIRWIELLATSMTYRGRPATHMAYIDITERKQMEEALHFQAQLLDSAGQAIIATRLDGIITYWNTAAEHLYGWSKEEVIGKSVLDLTLAQPVYARPGEIIERIGQGESWEGEFLARHRDGTTFPAWVTNVPFFDEQGQIRGVIGVSLDITERKQAEEAYRTLVDNSLQALVIFQDGRTVFANPAAVDITGYTQEELLAMSPEEANQVVYPDDRALLAERARQRQQGQDVPPRYEFRLIRKDGAVRWAECFNVRILYQGKPAVQMTYIDITERKQAEEQLDRTLAITRATLESSTGGVLVMALDGSVIVFNQRFADLWSLAEGWEEITDIHERVASVLDQLCDPDGFVQRIEDLLQHPEQDSYDEIAFRDGRVFSRHGAPYRIGERILGRLWNYHDITERKRMEEALRVSEERYSRAVTAGKVGVWEWDLTTNEMYLAPNLKAMLGYADHEIRNHLDDWGRFVHPDDQELVMAAATAYLRGETDLYEVEHRMLHKDGSVRWMVVRGSVFRDAAGNPLRMAGTDTDITDRKLAEHQLHQANVLLQQQAIRDALTGLYNRRYLDETLPRELQRTARQEQTVGVIMLDIDRFKRFNDTYGHDTGDTLLRAVGDFLQRSTRGADIACRYGGEEFILVLPGASLAATEQRAEELRMGLQTLIVKHDGQALGPVTVSLGVAVFPEHGATADSLIRAADQALYQAKRNGRNCVVVAENMPDNTTD